MSFNRAIILMFIACSMLTLLTGPVCAAGDNPAADAVSAALQRPWQWDREKIGRKWGRDAILLTGPSGYASVDEATGILIDLIVDHPSSQPEGTPIGLENATTAASAFVRRVGIPLDAWTVTDDAYHPRGGGSSDYSFTYKKYYQGVSLPSLMSVNVDASTGDIVGYFLVDEALAIPLQARISAGDALQIVVDRLGYSPPVKSIEPFVWFEDPENETGQTLYWEIHLANPAARTDDENYIDAMVDANTGKIEHLMMPLSMPAFHKSGKTGAAPPKVRRLPRNQTHKASAIANQAMAELRTAAKGPFPATVFEIAKSRKR